jgi:DNA polymerase III delta subunit
MARIVLEKEKLLAYCGEKRITWQDVEAVVPKDIEWQVYEFSNNIVAGKNGLALEQIAKLKRSKEEPAGLLAMLTSQFRRMLYAAISPLTNEELSELWKIKPFAVQKARESGWGKVKLRKAVVMLSEYEHKFKSGRITDAAAFDNAVLRLMGDAI